MAPLLFLLTLLSPFIDLFLQDPALVAYRFEPDNVFAFQFLAHNSH